MKNSSIHILVIEDDPQIRNFISYVLKQEEFLCTAVGTAQAGMSELVSGQIDLMILDLGLPDYDGIEVIQKVREWSEIPIVVVSARDQDQEKAAVLDSGADDYLTKPFGVMELISRVKALLRRSKSIQEDQILRLKNVTLDSEKRIVHVNDIPCELTFKEFELLKLLMINAGIVLRREVIMMDVWGTDYEGESRTLDMHIKTLRQKLGDAGNMIKTVRNVGYKME